MSKRSTSARQSRPTRKPWHVDYLHMRELTGSVLTNTHYARGRLLDVGCGNRPYEPWFTEVSEYVGIDVVPQAGRPDAVSMATTLPFDDASFDTVLSTQTLEHVEDPQAVVAEMSRVLRPGGYLILTAPQTWRLHEKPYDFYRYTRYGLQYLAEHNGLQVEKIVAQGGVWTTVGQTINNAIHHRWTRQVSPYGLYLLYLAFNAIFGALDSWWRDDDETLNYLLVARKDAA